MSIKIMTMVFETKLGSATIKAVAVKLADYANDEGGNIWPALDTIAEHTEVSKSSVQRAIRDMLERGIIQIEREGGKGPGSTTRYCFDLTQLSAQPKIKKDGHRDHDSQADYLNKSAKVVTLTKKGGHRDHRTVNEPSNKKEVSTSDRIWIDNGTIQLGPELTAFWLPEFDNDPEKLRLALIEAAGYVKTNCPYPLEAQVSSQLARRVRARKDREARKQHGSSPAHRRKSKSDEARDFLREIGIDPETAYATR
jgi:predicted transcriptional regulator